MGGDNAEMAGVMLGMRRAMLGGWGHMLGGRW